MAKAQILIVEDDAIIAMDIENRLKKLGFDVSGIVLRLGMRLRLGSDHGNQP